MGLIAITQRVDWLPDRCERRDALDQAWTALCAAIGHECVALPNGAPTRTAALMDRLAPDGLVLTGGNSIARREDEKAGTAPERDETERAALDWAMTHRLPVLAVCRGLQLVNDHLGGGLRRVDGHVAVRHAVSMLNGFEGAGSDVNSYHDWGVGSDDLAPALVPLAQDAAGNVEAFRHRDLPILAIMWHPERERPFRDGDLALIKEHLT